MSGNFVKFAGCFKETLEDEFKHRNFKETFANKTRYTKLINKVMKDEMSKMLKREVSKDIKYYPEYFKIDYTWWLTKNNFRGAVHLYDWELVCAVEHENDWTDWTYEVEKLDSINAKLKIVIGYMDRDKCCNEIERLRTQHSMLKNIKYQQEDYEFGVILLNRRLSNGTNPFGMKCYLMASDDIQEVSPSILDKNNGNTNET